VKETSKLGSVSDDDDDLFKIKGKVTPIAEPKETVSNANDNKGSAVKDLAVRRALLILEEFKFINNFFVRTV
jgi:hypothetical protein